MCIFMFTMYIFLILYYKYSVIAELGLYCFHWNSIKRSKHFYNLELNDILATTVIVNYSIPPESLIIFV